MNNNKSITFARLEAVLTELGLEKIVVPQKCVLYKHAASGTTLYVRLHKSNEVVPWDVIASARHHLEWNGVIESQAFEEMLYATAA